MADRNDIGHCRCPLCGSTSARLSVSAKQLAYVTCNGCQAQIFARSDRSDAILRATHVTQADPLPAPAPAPTPATTPKPAPAVKPAPAPQPEPPAPPPKAGMGWGIFS